MVESSNDVAGNTLPSWTSTVTANRQSHYHRCCGIDSSLYGEHADVTILGADCMRALTAGRIPVDGLVTRAQRLVLHTPVQVGETLDATGRVATVEGGAEGAVTTCVFEFRRGEEAAVTMEIILLRPDPSAGRDEAGAGAGRSSAPAEFQLVARKLLTPGMVAEYASEAGNRIHRDPAFAARFGYRAPLVSSHMVLSYLVEALRATSVPESLDLEAVFLRPLYWDDGFDLLARSGPGGTHVAFQCVNPRHVLVIEAATKA